MRRCAGRSKRHSSGGRNCGPCMPGGDLSSNGWGYTPPDLLDPAVLERWAEQVIASAVKEVAAERPAVEVEPVAAEGPAAQILLDAAGDADLLVVGSRGHGGFAGLLLGSVSAQCAHHAGCPVVIIRAPDADPGSSINP